MHFEDIKALLRKKGFPPAEVARTLKVSKQTVGSVMRGTTKSTRIANEISRITGLMVSEMWPGKYPDIEFLERLAQAKPSAVKAALHAEVATSINSTKRSPAKRRAA